MSKQELSPAKKAKICKEGQSGLTQTESLPKSTSPAQLLSSRIPPGHNNDEQ